MNVMNDILKHIKACIEIGKISLESSYPPDMNGLPGAYELTKKALEEGIRPNEILDNALIPAMTSVGERFGKKQIFVPQMLMSAKAMQASMVHITPFFKSGETKQKGIFIIGTVYGDLHDIGKNLVSKIVEGAGWEVIDLGVDVSIERFVQSIDDHPGAILGLSALLTTTMLHMQDTVVALKEKYPTLKIIVGGAPLTQDFCNRIGADFYSPDPQGAVEYMESLLSFPK